MKTNVKKLLIGALIGTVVGFVWGATEWFNPLLQQPYKQVKNQTEVNSTLIDNLDENGIYVWHKDTQLHLENATSVAEKDSNVMYFIAKNDGKYYQPGRFMGIEVLTQFLTWLLITYLFIRLDIRGHFDRIKFVGLLALVVGLGYVLPMWNWWGFSTEFVAIRWGNLLVGWLLAATAVSFYLKKQISINN